MLEFDVVFTVAVLSDSAFPATSEPRTVMAHADTKTEAAQRVRNMLTSAGQRDVKIIECQERTTNQPR